jgi:predicted DNA binding protein
MLLGDVLRNSAVTLPASPTCPTVSVIADFAIPADVVALEDTFESLPEVSIEIERLATHSREWVMPFAWVTAADLGAFETAAAADPSVDALEAVDTTGDVGLYNVRWSSGVEQLIDAVVDQNGIVLEADARWGEWYLKLRFLEQHHLEEFQAYFAEHDYSYELRRLVTDREPVRSEFDLTPPQREVLVAALEAGYFDVPRKTKITALAEQLDISANAASQRLRRASANLVRNTLTVAADRDLGAVE